MADEVSVTTKPRYDNSLADRFLEPLSRMRSGMDHLLEDFSARLPAFHFGGLPAVEMTETDDCYKIAVEVPGIPPQDIDLQVDRDVMILKGEKKEEHEEKNRDYVISERSYGAFERRIAIPSDGLIDEILAEASDGVLRISIPRSQDATSSRRHVEIQVKR